MWNLFSTFDLYPGGVLSSSSAMLRNHWVIWPPSRRTMSLFLQSVGMNQTGTKAVTSKSQGRNATIWLLNKYAFGLHHAYGIVVDDMEYNILLLPCTANVCLLKSVTYCFPIGAEDIIFIFMQYILNGKCKSKMCCLGYGWSSTLLMTCLRLS